MAESTDTTTSLEAEEKPNEALEDRDPQIADALESALADFKESRDQAQQLKKDDPEAYHQHLLDAVDSLAKMSSPPLEGPSRKGLVITTMLPPRSSLDT